MTEQTELLTAPEVARLIAPKLNITEAGARRRVYTAIELGELRARRYLGAVRIERAEVQRWRRNL